MYRHGGLYYLVHTKLTEVIDTKKNRFSKLIVAAVVLLNTGFTAVYLRVGSEPTTLIAAWFAFTTGELWMLAGIRKAKVKGGDTSADSRDQYPI